MDGGSAVNIKVS
jgi:hypothetical protein